MDRLIIKPCEINNINSIKHLQPENWSDILPHFRFFCQQSFCYPVLALLDNKIVGIANSILNGRTGWLSHIIVDQGYRRRGIGYQLTQHVIDYLYKHDCKTQLLIATDLGEPVYKKLGFRNVNYYWFFSGPKLILTMNAENLRPLIPSDLKSIYKFDKQISGENRKHMLEKYLSSAWIYIDEDGSNIFGYFLPEFGEGLIIANDAKAGIELLKMKHSVQKCNTVLPQENKVAIDFLIHNGFHKYSSVSRMILGEDISWQPNLIFSRVGGYYG